MTPAELTRALKPGKLTLLKYKVLRILGPWGQYLGRKRLVLIDSRLLSISQAASRQIELAAKCCTNADGARAWILPAAELAAFKNRLKQLPGAEVKNEMRLTMADGPGRDVEWKPPGRGQPFFRRLYCRCPGEAQPRLIQTAGRRNGDRGGSERQCRSSDESQPGVQSGNPERWRAGSGWWGPWVWDESLAGHCAGGVGCQGKSNPTCEVMVPL